MKIKLTEQLKKDTIDCFAMVIEERINSMPKELKRMMKGKFENNIRKDINRIKKYLDNIDEVEYEDFDKNKIIKNLIESFMIIRTKNMMKEIGIDN